jgi:hypothetical protein
MIQLYHSIDEQFEKKIIDKFLKDKSSHTPSGKLSAGQLCKPLLWQILKYLEVSVPQNNYLSLKFKRGKDVEHEFLKNLDGIVEQQKMVEYRDCVGVIDALIKIHEGIVPLEVKSVTSMKYKRIIKEGRPDDQYCMQGALYGLATNSDKFLISVVNADDFRPLTFMCDTGDYKQEINNIINKYDIALKERIMPRFEARYKWQENMDYSDFPLFSNLTPSQILEKLKMEYPLSYEKWNKKL